MADQEVQQKGAAQVQEEAVPQVEQVVVVEEKTTATPPPMTAIVEKEPPPVPESEEEEAVKPKQVEEQQSTPPPADHEVLKPSGGGDEKMPESGTFKEESNKVADLSDNEKRALEELKQLVREALNKHEFSSVTPPTPAKKEDDKPNKEENPAAVAVVSEEDTKQEAEDKPVPEPVVDEPAKPEPQVVTEPEEKQDTAAEVVETQVIEEKVADADATANDTVDDDGVKTVEAIEETIVSASFSVQQEQPPPAKETESKSSAVPQEEEEESKEGKVEESPVAAEEVCIWGIPLLSDERSDVVLLKFLRARDFKVKDAFTMLKNTVRWRKEFGIDELLEQDLGCDDLEKVVFMHGFDKEGHPVCYNVYGEFQNKELYQKTFSDEEKRQRFLRWRIQFLERSIRKLDFSPGAISTIVQVNDLKNSPGPGKWELRQATKQALHLLQDNYPEFVAKQVFINVPWWYLAVNKMISPFLTQRTRSKFVFAGPSKSTETLFRYISAEQVPVKYGGLSKDGEFATTDAVTEIIVRPAAKHTVEFPVTEACQLTWEVRVVGWEVSYGAEFVPIAEESYTVIIQKNRKVGSNEEPVVCNNFKIGEPGKVVLTIHNSTSKKKKLLYRLKTNPTSSLIQ